MSSLTAISRRIEKANGNAARSFPKWIGVVGPALEQARTAAESGKAFEAWALDAFKWKRSRVHQILSASRIMQALIDGGVLDTDLPQSEAWCRPLPKIPADVLPAAWTAFAAACRAAGTEITTAMVEEWAAALTAKAEQDEPEVDIGSPVEVPAVMACPSRETLNRLLGQVRLQCSRAADRLNDDDLAHFGTSVQRMLAAVAERGEIPRQSWPRVFIGGEEPAG